MSPVKVWLDDERPEPEGWVRARTPAEAIRLLESRKVEVISLDHDLGIEGTAGDAIREQTGYDVLEWIEMAVAVYGFEPPTMLIHTANPAARVHMSLAVGSIERLAGLS